MRSALLLALSAVFLFGACADDSGDDKASPEPPKTTAQQPVPPLAPTLKVLGGTDGEAYCDLLTVRYLYDNYGRSGPGGLRYCKRDARRDAASAQGLMVDAKVVNRGKRRALVAQEISGHGRVYVALVSDGERWLVDGISGDRRNMSFPYRPGPAVIEGVTADELESVILESQRHATEASCTEVEHQSLGEWECEVTVEPPGRPQQQDWVLVTVAPDGEVDATGPGGGCCLELRSG